MKKIAFILALGMPLAFMSCEKDDAKSMINIESQTGTLSFKLFDLEDSSEIFEIQEENLTEVFTTLSYERPDFGVSLAHTYSIEASFDATFPADKTIALTSSSNDEEIEIVTTNINTAILRLIALEETEEENGAEKRSEDADLIPVQKVYLRVKCIVSNAATGPTNSTPIVKPAYSNAIALNIRPFQSTEAALPATYYIIGLGTGWDNDPAFIGTSLIPLSMTPNYEYDAIEGTGVFTHTAYIREDQGFKLIATPGSWDDQWGTGDAGYVFQDGGSGNITVPADGFYTITLNTVTNELTIDPATVTPVEYQFIELIGDYNGWSNETVVLDVTPGSNGYVWYTDITLPDGGVKFRADGDWAVKDWGGDTFPFCTKPSGGNIPAKEGTYRVVFNQLDGCYMFFQK